MFPLLLLGGVVLAAVAFSNKPTGTLTPETNVFSEIPDPALRQFVLDAYLRSTDPVALCALANTLQNVNRMPASANQIRLRARQLGGAC